MEYSLILHRNNRRIKIIFSREKLSEKPQYFNFWPNDVLMTYLFFGGVVVMGDRGAKVIIEASNQEDENIY